VKLISIILMYFMIYSFIGWIWETFFESTLQKKFVNRGFLHGPFIPIYAFGAFFNVILISLINNILPNNILLKVLIIWLYTGIIASILEYITSYALEKAFQTRWWDYSKFPLNINGRVSVICSAGWGVAGCLLWFYIHPFISEVIYNIPIRLRSYLSVAFLTYFMIDLILTLKELISLRKVMSQLLVLSKELKDSVVYHIDNIKEEIGNKKVKISETIEQKKEILTENISNTGDKLTESFQEIKNKSGLLFVKARKGVKLSNKQEQLVRQFNSLLERSKRYSRFYNNYPKARSKRFKGLIEVVRKKLKK